MAGARHRQAAPQEWQSVEEARCATCGEAIGAETSVFVYGERIHRDCAFCRLRTRPKMRSSSDGSSTGSVKAPS